MLLLEKKNRHSRWLLLDQEEDQKDINDYEESINACVIFCRPQPSLGMQWLFSNCLLQQHAPRPLISPLPETREEVLTWPDPS